MSFLGEVGEEAHQAPSKMSAAKARAGGESGALPATGGPAPWQTQEDSAPGELLMAPRGALGHSGARRVWFARIWCGFEAWGKVSTVQGTAHQATPWTHSALGCSSLGPSGRHLHQHQPMQLRQLPAPTLCVYGLARAFASCHFEVPQVVSAVIHLLHTP